jgi:hypothetical protein
MMGTVQLSRTEAVRDQSYLPNFLLSLGPQDPRAKARSFARRPKEASAALPIPLLLSN